MEKEQQLMDYCKDMIDVCQKFNIQYNSFVKILNNFYYKNILNNEPLSFYSFDYKKNILEDVAKQINYTIEMRDPIYRRYKLENIIKKQNERRQN